MIIKGAPGNQKVFRQIRDIPKSFRSGIANANEIIGRTTATKAVKFVKNPPKTGRIYVLKDRVTGQVRLHQASASGESPATFSGSLAASIGYESSGNLLKIGAGGRGTPVVTAVGLGGQLAFADVVDYAKDLEINKNRPYLIRAIKDEQKNTENYYYQYIRGELVRGTRKLLK